MEPDGEEVTWEEWKEGVDRWLVTEEKDTPSHDEEWGWARNDTLPGGGQFFWLKAYVRGCGAVDDEVHGTDGGTFTQPETEGKCHKCGNEWPEIARGGAEVCDGNKGLDREPQPRRGVPEPIQGLRSPPPDGVGGGKESSGGCRSR